MSLAPLCHREIVCVSGQDPIRKAAEVMRKQHVGALAVTDPQDSSRVMGLLTDRDMVVDLLALGHSPDERTAGDLCRSKLVGVPASSTLQDAISHMQQHGVRRLFVAQADGSLMGLISIDDLIEAIADELGDLARTLRINIDKEDARTRPAEKPVLPPSSLYLVRHEP
jgi:CBS domain containing-hemolysin-like protein